jgi:hypothetical protein
MTTSLRRLLEQEAQRTTRSPAPLDDVMSGGASLVRRRRFAGIGVVAAVAALASVVVPGVVDRDDEPGIAGSGGFEARKATYAQGSTIHYGDKTIDVRHEVRALVQTDDGFVFLDPSETVYFTNGEVTAEIGHGGGMTKLAADDSGSYVAWVEVDEGEAPEIVVFDTNSGTEELRMVAGDGAYPGHGDDYDKPTVEALDSGNVYVANADGVAAVNIRTGESTTIFGPGDKRLFNDAANGRIAFADAVFATVVHVGLDGEEQRFPNHTGALLSPSGTRMVTDEVVRNDEGFTVPDDQREIVDVASREDVTPEWGSYTHVRPSQWVDDDTLIAYAFDEIGPADVLRCSVQRGECGVVATPGNRQALRFPVGYDTEEW